MVNAQKILSFPVSEEVRELLSLQKSWDSKRNNYYGLTDSKSILMKYNLDYPEGLIPVLHPENKKLYEALLPVIEAIRNKFNNSYCSRAIIACVPPSKDVKAHIDPGWTFSIQRRFCWVMQTNPQAFVTVGNETFHFQEGEVWQFNNKKLHGAVNDGTTDRVHFIFDIVVLEDTLAVTPAPFESGSYDDKFFNIILKKKQKSKIFEV